MRFLSLTLASLGLANAALARPVNGEIGLQPPATEIAGRVAFVHNSVLMPIIAGVCLLVLALLVWVIVRYNRRASPVARSFSHNTTAEIVWTIGPVFVLVAIASFTFPLLYMVEDAPTYETVDGQRVPIPESEWLTVKVQGNQWNWTYSYVDDLDEEGYARVEFVSNGLQKGLSADVAGDAALRNLEVDYPMVVPAGRYIRYYTAASDVIHSFAMPAFGIKTDAVPGRLNEGWFKVDEPGVYYGQCSELCGKDHAFMPIEIRVVPEDVYEAWYAAMLAGDPDRAVAIVRDSTIAARETRLADASR